MHKTAVPPPITSSMKLQSLQVDGILNGGIPPAYSWNDVYNEGVALDLTAPTVANPIVSTLIDIDTSPVYIDYTTQPFNYIELTSTDGVNVKPLAIRFIPTVWIYVYVNSTNDQIISPQTPYTSVFDPSNNYTLPAGSLSLVHIKPSYTSIMRTTGEPHDNPYSPVNNEQIAVSSIQLI